MLRAERVSQRTGSFRAVMRSMERVSVRRTGVSTMPSTRAPASMARLERSDSGSSLLKDISTEKPLARSFCSISALTWV